MGSPITLAAPRLGAEEGVGKTNLPDNHNWFPAVGTIC